MNNPKQTIMLAQSSSALGAAILGFGLGSKWGFVLSPYAFIIIIIGAVLHIWGMYIIQMSRKDSKVDRIAKALWISAWVCLIALIVILVYLFFNK